MATLPSWIFPWRKITLVNLIQELLGLTIAGVQTQRRLAMLAGRSRLIQNQVDARQPQVRLHRILDAEGGLEFTLCFPVAALRFVKLSKNQMRLGVAGMQGKRLGQFGLRFPQASSRQKLLAALQVRLRLGQSD